MTTQAPLSQQHPVAWCALLRDRSGAAAAVKCLGKQSSALGDAGILNLQFFCEEIDGSEVVVAIMDVKDADGAAMEESCWQALAESPRFKPVFDRLQPCLLPHPRHAGGEQSPWVRAETICRIRPAVCAGMTPEGASWHAAVTGLRKEKEAEYRLLHDNVWPGVVEAIGRSQIRRFDIFLIELGDPEKNQPYLFYRFQYSGDDFDKDMAMQAASPVNQRWWTFTDPCQIPLPQAAAKGHIWLGMIPLETDTPDD